MELYPQKVTFKDCVERVKEAFANDQVDWNSKIRLATNALSQYFNVSSLPLVMELWAFTHLGSV